MKASLRVAIDARIVSGAFGGVEQFTIGIVNALSRLTDGSEEYTVLAYRDAAAWVAQFVGGPCRLVLAEAAPTPSRWRSLAPPRMHRSLRRPWHALKATRGAAAVPLPESDGTLEALADVVHFPTQNAVITDLPSLYHPWDLQHRHLPELFTSYERLWRDVRYPTFARQASVVFVASEWGRTDLASVYSDLAPKIHVVPVPPVTEFYPEPSQADVERVRRTFGLEVPFAYYPAKTWPHKNHAVLLEALALLRSGGLRVPLVCSGGAVGDFAAIVAQVRQLSLGDQVRFLGYVSPIEVESLYRLARCLIYPSRFEGWGLPLMEAFRAGLPVACSTATCLPEQVGNAAQTFDPDDPEAVAIALAQLWRDASMRHELRRRGRTRVMRHSWARTAKVFRTHYRRVAGHELTDEDHELVTTPSTSARER